jgi:hypothetical protein
MIEMRTCAVGDIINENKVLKVSLALFRGVGDLTSSRGLLAHLVGTTEQGRGLLQLDDTSH